MTQNDRKQGQKTNWSVVVIHDEEETARERSVLFCDRLVERFWKTCEFNIGWWSVNLLRTKEPADQACEKAAEADMVVFSLRDDVDFPREFQCWVEAWVRRRSEREGTVVCLSRSAESSLCGAHLRSAAHRAGMDFLTGIPGTLMQPLPESLDNYSERAGQVTSVLDDILRQKSKPGSLSGVAVR